MRRLFVALVAVLAVATAACGDSGDDNPALEASPPPPAHNDADVTFAKGMIPHHQQAVEMSDLALTKAGSPKVKDLATRIKAAQGPEIEKMMGWLRDWGQPYTAGEGEHGAMGHGSTGQGGMGMMSTAEMQQLMNASGAAFDRFFLQGMIRHHEGAVTMAKEEQAKGQFADAKQLAGQIITSQEAEIAEMRGLLADAR